MASASAVRSPTTSSSLDQSDNCTFRRSKSRVFYESEITSGTSWEFRGIHVDSQTSPLCQMQLSVLRSPAISRALASPVELATSSSVLHRSIPSPPNKDDLSEHGSDGSRNSTGSSTGSHRSQDSGFSDSGETRLTKRASPNNITLHANSHLSKSRSQQCTENCCTKIQYHDSNKNSTLSNSQNRASIAFDHLESNGNSNQHHDSTRPNYSQLQYTHERCSSTPVPSPIPHSGSGCGKLIMKNKNSKIQQNKPSPLQQPHYQQNHFSINSHSSPQGNYGEINGNLIPECSNCIYQEIPMNSLSQASYHSPPYQRVNDDTYAMYTTVPSAEKNVHFGAPICSSTPKRLNPSPKISTSKVNIMQKIDNFETLNKNMKSLDNNNNSNGSGLTISNGSGRSNCNSPVCLSSNSTTSDNGSQKSQTLSLRNSRTMIVRTHNEASPLGYHGLSVSPVVFATSEPSSNSTMGMIKHTSEIQKKIPVSSFASMSSRNSASSITSCQSNQISSSSLMSNSNIAQNENHTVLHRAPLPLPSVPESNDSRRITNSLKSQQECNNNSLTLNEFSTYASHTKSKSCIKASPKWQNLPKGYKVVSGGSPASSFISEKNETIEHSIVDNCSETLEGEIVVKSHFDNDAMKLWLNELRSQTEAECSVMLQTKSICSSDQSLMKSTLEADVRCDSNGNSSDVESISHKSHTLRIDGPQQRSQNVVHAIHAIQSPLMSIKNVERIANIVSAEFAKICKNIEFGFLSQVPRLVLSLVENVEDFLRTFQSKPSFGNLQKLENKLTRSCRRLNRSANQMMNILEADADVKDPANVYSIIESGTTSSSGYHVAVSDVVDGIVTVGNLFSQVVDLRLTRDLSCILESIEAGGIPAKIALKSFVTVLIDGGNHLCRLASEIRTVRGLLGVILDTGDHFLRVLSLRCLATILCIGDAVKDFDRASGFEIVADFMYEPMYPFELKIEAVSVLTQATDPWIDLETSLCTLGNHLEKIIFALTNLIPQCQASEEPFLLVVAAISNLTFLEVSSIGILSRCGTMSLIIAAVDRPESEFSVFVLDHVATILANMAGVESCRNDIIKSGGVHALLKFLEKQPTPAKASPAEIMACERVQQKSTIAISRLCTEPGVAKLIVDRGGLHRLVMLSRNETERNYSDGVLIAALATLRKLVNICGDEAIRQLEADDLIQPRLLDSFLLYSSRQESYV